ncbi:hypothetical protein ILYODFUR_003209 [Ilyodon furcidens]|uniref:Uncharacterized protein n=1 Tax=Ilyodon furcidens TaxID=33524 RepID=A0ABV0SJU8_9TELE
MQRDQIETHFQFTGRVTRFSFNAMGSERVHEARGSNKDPRTFGSETCITDPLSHLQYLKCLLPKNSIVVSSGQSTQVLAKVPVKSTKFHIFTFLACLLNNTLT